MLLQRDLAISFHLSHERAFFNAFEDVLRLCCDRCEGIHAALLYYMRGGALELMSYAGVTPEAVEHARLLPRESLQAAVAQHPTGLVVRHCAMPEETANCQLCSMMGRPRTTWLASLRDGVFGRVRLITNHPSMWYAGQMISSRHCFKHDASRLSFVMGGGKKDTFPFPPLPRAQGSAAWAWPCLHVRWTAFPRPRTTHCRPSSSPS